MKIAENKFVSITYRLTVGGEVVENVTAEKPLEFIFGSGFLLPKFEQNLAGKGVGDTFKFSLEAEEAYGPKDETALIEFPKTAFMIDGVIEEGLLNIGNALTMSDNEGNRHIAVVKEVRDDVVMLDFNHPMAGKSLHFEGEVIGVRDVTEEDLMKLQAMMGGCGCGDDGCNCDDSCGCEEDKSSCGCGCGQ